jgi:hypothetical protein
VVGADAEEFRKYLGGIGMGAPLIERAEDVLSTVRRFLPEEPEFLFVSDFRDGEGNRNYSSLWVFTESYVSESHQFISQSKFDFIRRDMGISHISIDHEDYDLTTAQDSSRLKLVIVFSRFGSDVGGELTASGSNCDELRQILTEYLLPTLHESKGK